MFIFSNRSKKNLAEAHADLQTIFLTVIKYRDCTVTWGYRGEEAQNEAYHSGFSKLKFPESKHNKTPAMAVDVVCYPELYSDERKLAEFGNFVMGIAIMLKKYGAIDHDITWGGNWANFRDYAHFELNV